MSSVIDQIARELHVSNATVSRALNDRPGVGSELREKVLAKARELNYSPSFTARGLATSQTFTLGYFVREKPDLPPQKDPFYHEIQHGIEQVTAKTDYHLSVAMLTAGVIKRPGDFRFTRERRIDGMILAGPDIPSEFIMAMLRTDVPLVAVDNRLSQTAVNSVNVDDEGGAYQAAAHLLALGHSRIGVIAGPERWSSNSRRVAGYRRAMAERGLAPQVVHVESTTINSGVDAYHALMAIDASVTAVCAVNDSMAIGAIRAARGQGRSVPESLSVVGFDDIEWAQLNDPPLTTVRIPKQQMGKEAALRLLALLNNPDLLPSELILPVYLIERDSTAQAAEANA